MDKTMTNLVKAPSGEMFTLSFTSGLPAGGGPWLFVTRDGSIHAGEILWVDDALSPSGRNQVVRTTNPAGGLHSPFDIPVKRVIGYAFAGQQWPFSSELAG